MANYNDRGEEIPDTTPVEVPLRFRGRPDEVSRIRNLVHTAMSEYGKSQGMESFEEANDFDVEDSEALPTSAHEVADDDDQFRMYSRDASIDDEQKKEYVKSRQERNRPDSVRRKQRGNDYGRRETDRKGGYSSRQFVERRNTGGDSRSRYSGKRHEAPYEQRGKSQDSSDYQRGFDESD